MNHTIKLLMVLMVISFPTSRLFAEDGVWENYTHGNYVTDIAAYGDEIWCATQGGVVRWDTKDMTSILFNVIDGLSDNRATCIAIDSTGTAWVGTERGGVCCFIDAHWEQYGTDEGLGDLVINDITVSNSNDVYVATRYGIYKYNNGSWLSVSSTNMKWYYCISIAADGSIWAGYEGGVDHIFNSHTESFSMTDYMEHPTVRSVLVDGNDIWLGSYHGLVRYHDGEWLTFNDYNNPKPTQIMEFVRGSDGSIWVAPLTDNELYRFDGESWQSYNMEMVNIQTIFVDSENIVWGGYSYNGEQSLFKFTPENLQTSYYNESENRSSLHRMITGIYQLPDGDIAVETQYGLSTFHDGQWTALLPNKSIGILASSPGGNVYITGDYEGLYRLTDEGLEEIPGFNGTYPRCMVFEDEDTFWIGTIGSVHTYGGLFRYDNGVWTEFNTQNGLPGGSVHCLAIDHDGSLLMGTLNGLSRYIDGEWYTYSAEDIGIQSPYNSYYALSLAIDHSGTIYIGTDKGLYALNGSQGSQCFEGRTDILHMDSHGRLWYVRKVMAQWGDTEVYGIYTPTEPLAENGLPYTQRISSIRCLYVDNNDILWIGTKQTGLLRFIPDTIPNVIVSDTGPAAFTLGDNYPNPFNISTTIPYTVMNDGTIDITIYTITGQVVHQYHNYTAKGHYTLTWVGRDMNGQTVSSGVYLYSLGCGGKELKTKKMILMK